MRIVGRQANEKRSLFLVWANGLLLVIITRWLCKLENRDANTSRFEKSLGPIEAGNSLTIDKGGEASGACANETIQFRSWKPEKRTNERAKDIVAPIGQQIGAALA